MKILLVAGARPNFMKIAPIVDEIERYRLNKSRKQVDIEYLIVHTGQHYDDNMSKFFFDDLQLPEPNIYLGVGSGSHAVQTGKIMIEFEIVCLEEGADLVVVVGDVNSTLACSLVAAKLLIPVAHVEAGLRSFDRTMPEEINRILTDQISDYLFTTCEDANVNLQNEGIPSDKIFFVGNVMIDTLFHHLEIAEKSNILQKLFLKKGNNVEKYALVTLHRPSNVDIPEKLEGILHALNSIAEEIRVVFPVHPRTLANIVRYKLGNMINLIEDLSNFQAINDDKKTSATPPLGYIDFLSLMSNAALVLTDSGGIQEETTILGIPCLTLRENTERSITVKEGTNRLVGNDPEKIREAAFDLLLTGQKKKNMPKYWDGKASGRIVKVITSQG